MAEFLSDAWFAALAEAASRSTVAPDVEIAVGHVVRRGEADVRWTILLRDGRAVVDVGTVEHADVVLHDDEATAAAIHRGELTAQEAVARGRLKVSGDVRRLVTATSALAALGAGAPAC